MAGFYWFYLAKMTLPASAGLTLKKGWSYISTWVDEKPTEAQTFGSKSAREGSSDTIGKEVQRQIT